MFTVVDCLNDPFLYPCEFALPSQRRWRVFPCPLILNSWLTLEISFRRNDAIRDMKNATWLDLFLASVLQLWGDNPTGPRGRRDICRADLPQLRQLQLSLTQKRMSGLYQDQLNHVSFVKHNSQWSLFKPTVLFLFLKFYWNIFDLQSCINFRHITKSISYTYIHWLLLSKNNLQNQYWILSLFTWKWLAIVLLLIFWTEVEILIIKDFSF